MRQRQPARLSYQQKLRLKARLHKNLDESNLHELFHFRIGGQNTGRFSASHKTRPSPSQTGILSQEEHRVAHHDADHDAGRLPGLGPGLLLPDAGDR